MAAITQNLLTGTGAREITPTTLSSSDTLTYRPGKGQVLTVINASGGPLTLNIDGDGQDDFIAAGYGTVDVSGGLDITIPDGDYYAVPLDTISQFLQGTVTLTGAATAVAILTATA